jgi:hypothetical protein
VRGLIRVAAGAIGVLALGLPGGAQSPSPGPSASPAPSTSPYPLVPLKPTAVVVRLAGGFHPVNQWLAYERDGTARFEGTLGFEHGRFRARVDFAKVEQLLADAGMCTRHATLVRPANVAMDTFYYRVSVRCGAAWRMFTSGDAFEPDTVAHTRNVVRELEHIAANLKWERADDTAGPPDAGGRFSFGPATQR